MKFKRALFVVNAFTEASNKDEQAMNEDILATAFRQTRDRKQNGHVLFEHNGQKLRVDMKKKLRVNRVNAMQAMRRHGARIGYTFNVRHVTADTKLDI